MNPTPAPAPPPAGPSLNYGTATEYLFALKSAGVRFGIDRMARLAAALGHPERAAPVIHLAGTNGKGSVSAMLEAILRASGRRTGLYTSPHLVKLGERVQVDRRPLTEAEIVAYVNELTPLAARLGAAGPDEHPSFFEFMTAMAFLQFARQRVDASVIEVGLGGRLDATNVVQPAVTVITSIGLDHLEQLGHAVSGIAREKAGIIKPGCPVVLGRVPPEAEHEIRRIARERAAPLVSVRETYGEDVAGYPTTNLEGDYQRWNAGTATLAAQAWADRLGLPGEAIRHGLHGVSWPGRWQRRPLGGRLLILDAAHNPEGAQVLEVNLRRLHATTGERPIIVAGALGAFRARALLEVFDRHAREVYLVTPQQARACTAAEMVALAPPGLRARLHPATLAEVFPGGTGCAVGPDAAPIVVTGSIYLLGEVLAWLEPGRGPGEGRLQDF